MTIRLLSYDCDGTAYLNARHEIPPSTMKALRYAATYYQISLETTAAIVD